MISFYINENGKKALISCQESFYQINVAKLYGEIFSFHSSVYQECDRFELKLSQNPDAITCPFCGGNQIKVHQRNSRKINDVFYLSDADDDLDSNNWNSNKMYGTFLFLDLIFENYTYRCQNKKCWRLFKPKMTFLPENSPKSHATNRYISFALSPRGINGDSPFVLFPIYLANKNVPFKPFHFQNICSVGISIFADASNEVVIGKKAFFENQNIGELIIEDGIKRIGKQAFDSCHRIKSVIIADSVAEIEPEAFRNCSNLQEIVLPESLEKIRSDSFRECDALKLVTIKNKVHEIEPDAFSCCFALEKIVFQGTAEQWKKIRKAPFPRLVEIICEDAEFFE